MRSATAARLRSSTSGLARSPESVKSYHGFSRVFVDESSDNIRGQPQGADSYAQDGRLRDLDGS